MDRCDTRLSYAAGKKRVLCVGNTVIDCISIVKKFPKINCKVRSLKGYWQRGGHASNAATVLRNLGMDVELFAVLSTNPMFRFILDDLRLRGIEFSNCPLSERTPPFSSVILARDTKSCTITTCYSSFPYVTLTDFEKLDLSKYGWVHFRGQPCDVTRAMLKVVKAYNDEHPSDPIIISIDVNRDLSSMWRLFDYCDYAFLSKQLGPVHGWKSPRDACRYLDEIFRTRFGAGLKRPFVLFLWGRLGAGLLDPKGDYVHSRAQKNLRIVDPLGAGEAFLGAFIYAVYVRERSATIAAAFANRIASHKCSHAGFDHIADILLGPDI